MSEKYQMPIYFSSVTYNIRHYGKRKGKKILLDKINTKTTNEVHIGNTVELLNNKKYNNRLLNSLKIENEKNQGCELTIINVEPIVQCGFTNYRFKDEE
jgi:squalene cyclase